MRAKEINTIQFLVNKINAKKDFTYHLNGSKDIKRYVVSCLNIYTGKNPSLFTDMNLKLNEVINKDLYDSIGLWYCKDKNTYFVDANVHFYNLDNAKDLATTFEQIAIYDLLTNETIYI